MYQMHTGPRNNGRKLDIIHIVLGIVIVVMAVMAFISPEENMVLFPLIFFTAAAIRMISAYFIIRSAEHDKKINTRGIGELAVGILILILGIVSAVSIW